MKKTERNHMESKAPHTPSSATASVRRVSKGRRILISILSLLMVVGIGLGVGLGIANKNMGGGDLFDPSINGSGSGGSSLAGSTDWEDYDKTYRIKGTDKEKQDLWKEAVGAANNGKKILVMLDEDWTANAIGGVNKFGSDGTPSASSNGPFSGVIMVGDATSQSPLGIDGMLHIPSGYDITIDLNGYKLNRNLTAAADGGCVILTEGNLTITDSSGNNAGQITGGFHTRAGGGIYCKSGSVTLEGGTICKNKTVSAPGGGFTFYNGTTFTMNGGAISENQQGQTNPGGNSGGGVSFVGTLFTMNGGKISKNVAEWGGGVSIGSGTFNMNGGIIGGSGEGNVANAVTGSGDGNGQGGGIYGNDSSGKVKTININGGVISHNESYHNGGGISVGEKTDFNLTGGEVVDNVSHGYGGGGIIVRVMFNQTFHMSGGLVARNLTDATKTTGRANARGGGIYLNTQSPNTKIKFSGGTVTDNRLAGTTPVPGTSGVAEGTEASCYFNGVTELKCIYLDGPFVCDGNQNGNFSIMVGVVQFIIQGPLQKGGRSAHIGISSMRGDYVGGSHSYNLGYLKQGSRRRGDSPSDLPTAGGSYATAGKALTRGYIANAKSVPSMQTNFFSDEMSSLVIYGTGAYGTGSANTDPSTGVYEIGITRWEDRNTANVPGTVAQNTIKGQWSYSIRDADGNVQSDIPVTNNADGSAPVVKLPYGTTLKNVHLTWTQRGGSSMCVSTNEANLVGPYVTTFGTTSNYPDSTHHFQGSMAPYTNKNNAFPGGNNGTGVSAVGQYTFVLNSGNICDAFMLNPILNVEILPADVQVTIHDKTIPYGLNKAELDAWLNDPANGVYTVTGLPNGVTAESLGIKVEKTYGTDANRSYTLRGAWNASAHPDFNVTFNNVGKLTITQREVNIILNDDEVVYGGDIKESEIKKINEASNKVINQSFNNTQAKDKDGNNRTVDGTPTGDPLYLGGWRYFDSTGSNPINSTTDTKHQIVSRDFNVANNVLPFEFEIVYTSSAWESGDNDKYFKVGSYAYKLKGTNPNYKFTIHNSSGIEGDAAFKVIKADFSDSLKASASTPKYNETTNDGTAKTIVLPTDTLTLQGYQDLTKAGITMKYLVYGASDTVPTELNDSNKEDWATATAWVSASSSVSKTTAGSYTVYTLVSSTNHNDKVYKWTFSIGQNGIKYRLVIKYVDGNGKEQILQATNGNLEQVYKKGSKVTVSVQYEWEWDTSVSKPATWDSDVTAGNGPDIKIYYKGTDSGNKHGAAAGDGVTYPDESLTDANPPAPAGLGSLTAPEEGGDYTATMIDKATASNYSLTPDSGNGYSSALNFKITPQEITAPTAPTGATYTYNNTVQAIVISSFNKDSMTFVPDTANGYVEDTAPNGGTDPNASAGEKLTFSKETKAVRVKNAGEYKLKFKVSNTKNYKWSDAATNASAEREVKIIVNGAPVFAEWTNSENANPWKWDAGTAVDIKYTLKFSANGGAAYDSDNDGTPDEVQVRLYWRKSTEADDDKSACSGVVDNTLSITATDTRFQTSGGYVLILEIGSDDVSKNYAFDSTRKDPDRVSFTVDSASVNTSALAWELFPTKRAQRKRIGQKRAN